MNYFNKLIKKFVANILIIFLLNMNCVYAQNWVTISAENGKSADLDIDSISVNLDAVEYDIRIINDNYIYINRMSTELYKDGTPTAVVSRSKYSEDLSNNNKISSETIKNREYRKLKAGTLQAEIFDVLSKKLEKKSFNKGQSTWNNYLKKQRKQILKSWKPAKFSSLNVEKDISTYFPVYQNDISLDINKNGKIVDRHSSNDMEQLYEIYNIDPLPSDYTQETFNLNVKMSYYKYAGAKVLSPKPTIKQTSPVSSEIVIAKNSSPPVIGHIQFGVLYLYSIVNSVLDTNADIPILLLIPAVLGGFAGTILLGAIFIMVGGDIGDL